MTTIMSVGNSEGTRGCDAKCHEATADKCDCICAGRYHGKGESQAIAELGQDVKDGVWGEGFQHIALQMELGE